MSEKTAFPPMSPLADPVVGAIFTGVEDAGLAAESFVRSIIDHGSFGTITAVTPQNYYKQPNQRGCRVDIEIETDDRHHIIVEVQLYTDKAIMQRNMFAMARIISAHSVEGMDPDEMADTMPKIIAINLLNYNCREDNTEFLQPAKILYTKPPHSVAAEQFEIYNVQLKRFAESEVDFTDPLSCWIYAMYKAHNEKLSVGEVLDMTPKLRDFAAKDAGFMQYCMQYKRVSAEPSVRKEYMRWVDESMRQAGMVQSARQEGIIHVAINMLRRKRPLGEISEDTGLPLEEIEKLKKKHNL
ncbi:hypothetical protein FACS1894105_03980 [Clostridia bacterium]|nr:hypothetical protein FACS1894105_03980 [Clostridia bacterium]